MIYIMCIAKILLYKLRVVCFTTTSTYLEMLYYIKKKLTMMHSSIRHCWQFFCKIIFARSNEIVIRSYKESSNNWQFNKFVPFSHVFHGVLRCIHDVKVLTAFLLKRIVEISSERMIVRVLKPGKKTSDRSIWDFFFKFHIRALIW